MKGVLTASLILALVPILGCSSDQEEAPQAKASRMERRLERLRSVPYTSVTADTVDASKSGVITYDTERTWEGYNLYGCGRSGGVVLMDMSGRIVHRWMDPRQNPGPMIYPVMLQDGRILVAQRSRGLLCLDWDSNVIWAEKSIRAHHDITVLPDSTIYTLGLTVEQYRGLRVSFTTIVRLTLAGEILETWSTLENLDDIRRRFDQRSFLDTILDSLMVQHDSVAAVSQIPKRLHASQPGCEQIFDYLHGNTVSILPENPLANDPRFKPGNLLTCFRNVNQIAILEKDTKEILWVWGEGQLEWPHHPTMVKSGNILIFDNGVERKHSRVLEVNPVTGVIEWQYVGDPPEGFFSRTRGSCQRLPNGNTLICDSESGRCFEVTREGEIIWEWLNPAMSTKSGKSHRAQLYRMERLPAEMVEPLLDGSS
jgi:hypothetical protein